MLNEVFITNKYVQISLALIAIVIIGYLAIYFLNKKFLKNSRLQPLINFLEDVAMKPSLLFITGIVTEIVWRYLKYHYQIKSELSDTIFFYFINIAQGLVFCWLLINLIDWVKTKILEKATASKHFNLIIFIPSIVTCLRLITFLAMFNIILPTLHLNEVLDVVAEKFTHIFLILSISWVFYNIISSFEKFIINKYIAQTKNIIATRKLNTQVIILKKILVSLLLVVTISAILMAFDSIKSIGENILTTAGILSAVVAFASQQSLSRLFAGLQIAMTQPVRIGDSVIINDQYGEVEEITLSFVTIKLWDLRTLIIPTDNLISKGLLNLTRDSSELLGTVFIYTDYTLPVEPVRNKFMELLNANPLWNKKVAQLDVSDIKEQAMELRGLVSADNAGDLWKLRCHLREALIEFIAKNYLHCLTKQRNIATIENALTIE